MKTYENKLSKKNDDDSKKLINEMEKVKKRAVAEKEKHEERVKKLGKSSANFNESAIFDDVDFV